MKRTSSRSFFMFAAFMILLNVVVGIVLEGCGALFPKCDDPQHPCAPVQPDYPPLDSPTRVGVDAGEAGASRR